MKEKILEIAIGIKVILCEERAEGAVAHGDSFKRALKEHRQDVFVIDFDARDLDIALD